MKIQNLDGKTLLKDFEDLVIELECGDHFIVGNSQHETWIKRRVDLLLLNNGIALGLYSEKNEPMGFILFEYDKGLENVRCMGKKVTIKMLGLFEQYRSKNFGGLLLAEMENMLKNSVCECIYVDTYAKDIGAIRYYVKSGFIPIANHPGEHGIDDEGQIYLYKKIQRIAPNLQPPP
jgi:ribosomal protein S18 acetylase RimI-like enzyme